jgi:energy-coupling factor transport system ATP-binding protein
MMQVAGLLNRLAEQGKTLIVITHDPELIVACCSHAITMEGGRAEAPFALDEAGTARMLGFFGSMGA